MKRIKKALDLDQKTKKRLDENQVFFFGSKIIIEVNNFGFFNKMNGKVKYLQQKLLKISNSYK